MDLRLSQQKCDSELVLIPLFYLLEMSESALRGADKHVEKFATLLRRNKIGNKITIL